MNSKETILKQFQSDKLEPLYKDLYAGLLRYACDNLKEGDLFLAEDCVQNAIYKAWKRKSDFTSLFTLKSFLYVSIRNEIISIYRKRGSRERYIAQLEDDANFEHSVIERETLDLIYKAIAELEDRDKRVIELSFIEKMKNADIAALMDISESSVEKCKARALKALRLKLPPLAYFILFMG